MFATELRQFLFVVFFALPNLYNLCCTRFTSHAIADTLTYVSPRCAVAMATAQRGLT